MRARTTRSGLLADRGRSGILGMTLTAFTVRAQDDSVAQEQEGWRDPAGPESNDGQWNPDGAEGGDEAQAVQAAPAALPVEQDAAAGAEGMAGQIQWISPSTDSALNPGGQITAQWRTDTPLDSPGFQLCTNGQCGAASYPKVVHAEDGTSSARLSLPDMPNTSGMYLQMSPGGTYADTTSPAFNVNLAAAAASAVSSTGMTGTGTSEPTSSPTRHHGSAVETTAAPTATPFPTQLPSAMTGISLPSFSSFPATATNLDVQPSTAPSMQVQQLQSQAARPNAVAIAVPIAICGLILLAALGFCARNKLYRPPGRDEEKNWEEIVKAKAAASTARRSLASQGAPMASAGVSVIPRDEARSSVHGQDQMREFAALPVLGYDRGQCGYSGPREQRGCNLEESYIGGGRTRSREGSRDRYIQGEDRRDERDRRYEWDSRRGSRGYDMEHAHSNSSGTGTRRLTPMRERDPFTRVPSFDRRESRSGCGRGCDDDGSRDRDRYYSTSRRTSSSIGGMSECTCRGDHHRHGRGHTHRRNERERGADLDDDFNASGRRPSWSRISSAESAKSGRSIVNPHPHTPLGPHGHPMSLSLRMSQSRSRSSRSSRSDSTFASPLEEYRAHRPLPPVKVRESQYAWRGGSGMPHRTGVLEREDSRTSSEGGAAWGKVKAGGGGAARMEEMSEMDGLYESLRLAIGSPAPGRQAGRSL